MKQLVMLAAVLAMGLVTACAEKTDAKPISKVQQLAEFKQAIRAKYDMKEAAFANNDLKPIVYEFYSDQVITTDFESHTHEGREELRKVYEQIIGATVKIESYKSFVNGDAGWDWVNFHIVTPPAPGLEPVSFKMLFLWEKVDGDWVSHGEMYVIGAFDVKS